MIGDTTDLLNAFGSTASAGRMSPLNSLVGDSSLSWTSNDPVATLQPQGGRGSVTATAPTPTALPTVRPPITRKSTALPGTTSTIPSTSATPGSDIWGELQNELGGVGAAFDTGAYDTAAEKAMGNITTQADVAANSAAAEYANRARQAGGNAEGAGLIRAEGMVSGRTASENVRLEQVKYDITQKEAAKQLSAEIAAHIDSLRMDYLKNLTTKQIADAQEANQLAIAKLDASTRQGIASGQLGLGYAQLAQNASQFDWLHPTTPAPYSRPGWNTPTPNLGYPGWGGPGSAYAPGQTYFGVIPRH